MYVCMELFSGQFDIFLSVIFKTSQLPLFKTTICRVKEFLALNALFRRCIKV